MVYELPIKIQLGMHITTKDTHLTANCSYFQLMSSYYGHSNYHKQTKSLNIEQFNKKHTHSRVVARSSGSKNLQKKLRETAHLKKNGRPKNKLELVENGWNKDRIWRRN